MFKWCLLGVFFPWVLAQAAGGDFDATPAEQAMCQAVIYDGRDTSERENWSHMHHFCDCVRFTSRAITKTGYARDYDLDRGIGGCDYVFTHTKPDFNMRGEVHLQKGKALSLQGKVMLASSEFVKALSINPDLIPAYVALSDHYARLGIRKEALNFAVEGLKRAPDSRVLQRRYTELGGKLPFPEPLKRVLTVPEVGPEAPPAAAQPNNMNSQPSAEDKKIDAAPSNSATPVPTDVAPIIGTPASPWCRFCPPP